MTSSSARVVRILYIVTEDWYFLSHRLPMARAARDAGFDVHVATNVGDGAAAIANEGFILHPVPFVRGRIDPLGNFEPGDMIEAPGFKKCLRLRVVFFEGN